MKSVGACDIFRGRYGWAIKFPSLDELGQFSASVFDNAGTDTFPKLLLVAVLTRIEHYAGFDLTAGQGRFGIFAPDEDPDRWVADKTNWSSFTEWLIRLVESKGEDDLL